MKKNSNRIIKINEEIKHELSAVIRQGLKDPRVDSLISIIDVDTTGDLKHCKVYFSTLGDERKHQETLEGLKNSAGFIRRELARKVNLRNTPELHFHIDHSIEYGVNMNRLISEVNAHDRHEDEPSEK
jgi:ribosome-binding factor A